MEAIEEKVSETIQTLACKVTRKGTPAVALIFVAVVAVLMGAGASGGWSFAAAAATAFIADRIYSRKGW